MLWAICQQILTTNLGKGDRLDCGGLIIRVSQYSFLAKSKYSPLKWFYVIQMAYP